MAIAKLRGLTTDIYDKKVDVQEKRRAWYVCSRGGHCTLVWLAIVVTQRDGAQGAPALGRFAQSPLADLYSRRHGVKAAKVLRALAAICA